MDPNVRNVAPFIGDIFTVTSEWWQPRWGKIHKGLDISTGPSGSKVYSMLDGKVLDVGNTTTAGNYIVIYDDNEESSTYGYATRYLHLAYKPLVIIGQKVVKGQEVGLEGKTGEGVTGTHLHVEMQDVSRFNFRWHFSNEKSDYLDPTEFMGIDNEEGTRWLYDGTPTPTPTGTERKHKFKWVLYANKLRKRNLQK